MPFVFSSRFAWNIRLLVFGAFAGIWSPCCAFPQVTTNASLLSIDELKSGLVGRAKKMSCRVEGIVQAVVPERGILVLQDASGTALLELPQIGLTVAAGEKIAIEANPAFVTQNRFGIRMEDVPVVDNSGLHSAKEMAGDIFLDAGMNPIRVDWFNGPAECSLNLDYEGPEIPRQKVSNSILWHVSNLEDGRHNLQQGLLYRAYTGVAWFDLSDFSPLNSLTTGVATNFSIFYRPRDENCGLAFNGLIQIDYPGLYTFFLESDDGSRLYIGKSSISCRVIDVTGTSVTTPETFEQALADRNNSHWVKMEGEVVFVSKHQRSLNLEVVVGGNHVPVTVVEGMKLFSTNLLHCWIQVQGVCEFSRNPMDKRLIGVFVPGSEQVKIDNPLEEIQGDSSKALLTTAAQVRRLQSTEAEKHIPAKIRGVVIFASSATVVLQDSSGGVFISNRGGNWREQPKVGELWEIEGTTDAGQFSPVITADNAIFYGYAPLPEPIQPTKDQLINGNMDAEYGELHGVVISVSTNEIILLTPDGKVSVLGNEERLLPVLPQEIPSGGSLVGSVVRIRGCFAPLVDTQTRQVVSGKTYLYPASVEMEDAAPQDPFLLPSRKPSDLMWFNARAVALQRTKLAGQIIYLMSGEYFVQDGKTGFRVLTQNSSLKVGDLIEAVGFPKLDGPSPTLQAAQIRETGHVALPGPVLISPEELLNRDLDSTLIAVKALLVSDTIHQEERILELQSGPQHFVARLEYGLATHAPLPAGCRLQLTGVYASAYGDQNHVGTRIAPFEVLLNSAADIEVLQRPPWWTLQRVVIALVILSGVLSATFIWVALLRRRIEQRTVQLKKEIEQRQLVEQHHAIELERTRVARDLHDELGAGLTEVGLLGSLANTPAIAAEARNHYLDRVTQMARSLVASLDEIVWAINPHYDSLPALVSYFSLYAESFLNLARISCRLRVAEDIPQHSLDSKQRHGIFCIFKEALNNVIRHSSASEVQIVFEVSEEQFLLSVIDNGCGFEFVPESPGKDGLASLRQRMHELGGICQINSELGCGTTIRISLPLNKNQHGYSSDS